MGKKVNRQHISYDSENSITKESKQFYKELAQSLDKPSRANFVKAIKQDKKYSRTFLKMLDNILAEEIERRINETNIDELIKEQKKINKSKKTAYQWVGRVKALMNLPRTLPPSLQSKITIAVEDALERLRNIPNQKGKE